MPACARCRAQLPTGAARCPHCQRAVGDFSWLRTRSGCAQLAGVGVLCLAGAAAQDGQGAAAAALAVPGVLLLGLAFRLGQRKL